MFSFISGAIKADTKNKQVLDKLQVERERGITVKAQTASVIYKYNGMVSNFLGCIWEYQLRYDMYPLISCLGKSLKINQIIKLISMSI